MIDCLDRGRFFPATILYTREESDNDLLKIDFRIGFRVYPEYCENWKDYKKYWNGKEQTHRDSNNKIYFGDSESIDEWIPYYSKRIDK